MAYWASWGVGTRTEAAIFPSDWKKTETCKMGTYNQKSKLNVIQQSIKLPKRIVLPLFTKALNEFGFFEGIVRSGKTIRQVTRMIYQVSLKRLCMPITSSSHVFTNSVTTYKYTIFSQNFLCFLIKGCKLSFF